VFLLFAGLAWDKPEYDYHVDEGIEVMKAQLWLRGEPLYGALWNDQPPLHTFALALMFRLAEPSVNAARAVSWACAGLLAGTLAWLAKQAADGWTAGLAVGLMFSVPVVWMLSGAALMSLPAYALALWAAYWAWPKAEELPRGRSLWVGGALFGLALQTKLTALLLAPPVAIHWWLMSGRGAWSRWVSALAQFGGTAGLAWLAVQTAVPGESLAALLGLHFDGAVRAAFAAMPGVMTLDAELIRLWPLMALAFVGLGSLVYHRDWQGLFPFWMLVSAYVAHRFYRPFWDFYLLHFAVPLGWLAAVGIRALATYLWRLEPRRDGTGVRAYLAAGVGAVLLAAVTVQTVNGWWVGATGLRPEGETVGRAWREWKAQMQQQPQWVFTDSPIHAFRLGMMVPPEICVLSKKRLLAGRLPPEELVACLRQRKPELIAIPDNLFKDQTFLAHLASNYTRMTTIGHQVCYRRVQPEPASSE